MYRKCVHENTVGIHLLADRTLRRLHINKGGIEHRSLQPDNYIDLVETLHSPISSLLPRQHEIYGSIFTMGPNSIHNCEAMVIIIDPSSAVDEDDWF